MTVGDVMTSDVWAVRPETTLKEAAKGLVEWNVSGAPVVDEDGQVVGVVSEADIVSRARGVEVGRLTLLAHLLAPVEDHLRRLTAEVVGDAMTTPALTIRANRPVQRAASLMLDRDVKRLPVVDEEGRLVGIVTRRDLVRAFARSDAAIAAEIEQQVLLSPFGLPPDAVAVTVEHGVVTLVGRIESEETAELLVRYVQRVLGVVRVESRLSVPPRGTVAAS